MSVLPEIEPWLDTPEKQQDQHENTIDALFGCHSKLPRLMRAASDFDTAVRSGRLSPDEIVDQASQIQERIYATKLTDESHISLGLLCEASPSHQYYQSETADVQESRSQMLAAAEIFRHSCHLYVFRTAYGQEIPLTADMQTSLETALDLLPKIPSALGPGANLGWCLVVLGAELNAGDDRVTCWKKFGGGMIVLVVEPPRDKVGKT
ncbi:hypothetical protein E8E14_001288 [Neopestalotiopsis sp. 37M]|nr:hypothetical protein E8E14_001288 [Neopestalotiopsis sp. 37M]